MNSLLTVLMLVGLCVSSVNAEELEDDEIYIIEAIEEQPIMNEMYATIYCSGTRTADGTNVHEGVCAVAPEHIGETVIIYTLDHELIGIYECKDTGGQSIKEGNVIDIYFNTEERGKEFIRKTYENNAHGKVLVQYVEAQG